MTRYNHGEKINYEARFEDLLGVGILNATGEIAIRRTSDDNYWTGAAWQAAIFQIPMIEIGETNRPGIWRYLFDLAPHTSDDIYIGEVTDSSGNAQNTPFNLTEDIVSATHDDIGDDLKRILGLNHDNFVLDPTAYDAAGRMTTGEVRIYNSKANTLLDDEVTGLLHKYTVTSVRTVQGFLAKFTQVREL